jgi:hypothetical protein
MCNDSANIFLADGVWCNSDVQVFLSKVHTSKYMYIQEMHKFLKHL